MNAALTPLQVLAEEIHACRRCPRLVEFLQESRGRRPEYWSRPVSGFGDAEARVVLLGLAPGMHGANRHGRVFTGDDSGRWLWGALYELGVCSQPNSLGPGDGMTLEGVYVSNAVRCVPPQNRPTPAELTACREFLRQELELLPNMAVVVALGRLAHETYLRMLGLRLAEFPFSHAAVHPLPNGATLVDSYHPSRQNTNTGVLTWERWMEALGKALRLGDGRQLSGSAPAGGITKGNGARISEPAPLHTAKG